MTRLAPMIATIGILLMTAAALPAQAQMATPQSEGEVGDLRRRGGVDPGGDGGISRRG